MPIPDNCYSKKALDILGDEMCKGCQVVCNPTSPINSNIRLPSPEKTSWIDEVYQYFIEDAIKA